MPYEWRWGMDEVSGFGGQYEKTVRAMIRAGLEWWDRHPKAKPEYMGLEKTFGFLVPTNEDAKAMTQVLLDASEGQATGAMHHVAVNHIFWIRANGWRRYVWAMRCRRIRSMVKDVPFWLRRVVRGH